MTDASHPLETILLQCAQAAPQPWYPSVHAKDSGIDRNHLDPHLDELRLAGLIRLTEWVPERGQGYVLTPAGEDLVRSPRQMARLRKGTVPFPASSVPEPLDESETSPWDRGEAVRSALLHPVQPRVTLVLLFLNLAVFAIGLALAAQNGVAGGFAAGSVGLQPRVAEVLLQTGALSASTLGQGEWWRLLSCCFVHIGLLHLGVNMYFFKAVGGMVESMWGHGRFLVLYLLAGFAGSCAMATAMTWREARGALEPIGAGASGALWGLMLAEAAWIFVNRQYLPQPLVSGWLGQLRNCVLLNIFISFLPGISAAAHFGGGAAGVVAALLLNHDRFSHGWQRLPAILGLIGMPVVCVLLMLRFQGASAGLPDPVPQEMIGQGLADPALAKVVQAEQHAYRYFERHAEPLLKQAAAERTNMDVTLVLNGLRLQIDSLQKTQQQLTRVGALPPDVLQRTRRLLEEETKLLAEAVRCLEEKSDWADDRLVQQAQEVKRRQADHSRAVRRLRDALD